MVERRGKQECGVRDVILPLWGAMVGIFWSNFYWFQSILPWQAMAVVGTACGVLGLVLIVYIIFALAETLNAKGW
jgi:hypothetical protein